MINLSAVGKKHNLGITLRYLLDGLASGAKSSDNFRRSIEILDTLAPRGSWLKSTRIRKAVLLNRNSLAPNIVGNIFEDFEPAIKAEFSFARSRELQGINWANSRRQNHCWRGSAYAESTIS